MASPLSCFLLVKRRPEPSPKIPRAKFPLKMQLQTFADENEESLASLGRQNYQRATRTGKLRKEPSRTCGVLGDVAIKPFHPTENPSIKWANT